MHKNENKELKSKLASLQERLSDKEVGEEKYQRIRLKSCISFALRTSVQNPAIQLNRTMAQVVLFLVV